MKKSCILMLMISLMLSSCSTSSSPKVDRHQSKMASATRELGEAYMAQGNYTAALKEFITAEKVIPNDPYLQNDLGLAYMAKNRFDLAEIHFKKAIELNPEYVPAKNNLGSAYLKGEKWDLAIECFKEISDNLLYATPHYPLSNLGWAYLGKGDMKIAEHYFQRSLKEQPDFINAIHGLATVYIIESNFSQALDLLKEGIKRNSQTSAVAILHSDIAKVYERYGNYKEADRHWRKVLEIAPQSSSLAQEANKKIK
ncbi:TPR repeat domain protein [Desulfamplus magnetovallimortis]|uniref:TPR repeat domain protein n=1 Tax=Desulfamplus magnetovallimortis TaxID=1246637 RepID=A0A1W1HH13_9BACT|nr:tetratricopeptide repeat protein [Desulfamplus magnetovallimortis]SLM31740.1 TPR repeat domain protein [Desulfamplus magnetovallimortis]